MSLRLIFMGTAKSGVPMKIRRRGIGWKILHCRILRVTAGLVPAIHV